MTRDDVKELKKTLSKAFPDAKSTHLYEAIASGFDCGTYAGLLTKIDNNYDLPEAMDYERFDSRLQELMSRTY